ncbi:MAG: ParB/RepB/Spo0J family partition protein [Sphingobacteriales bacterium]|nr:MAG: ParB/RepB/Spo0J family partition protein [Sphingobacteriales bacterium]
MIATMTNGATVPTATKPTNKGGVMSTKDYALFQIISGNRKIDKKHVEKLKASIKDNDLFNPILVNEDYQIIDGQHRFTALHQLGMPIKYMVVPGYGIKQVQLLNTHSKNWSVDDYMECYISQGIKDYQTYKEFRQSYGFTHQQTLEILGAGKIGDKNYSRVFREGQFKIGDLNKAVDTFQKINALGKHYDGYKRRGFVSAIVACLKNKKFDFEVFESKLVYQSRKLAGCASTEQYLAVIEEVYNYKSRAKVSLKY